MRTLRLIARLAACLGIVGVISLILAWTVSMLVGWIFFLVAGLLSVLWIINHQEYGFQ